MRRRIIAGVILLTGLWMAAAPEAFAMATPSRSLTVLAVPAQQTPLQVGFDLIERRNVVLVAYQGSAGSDTPVLHAWDGSRWLAVGLDAFSENSYLAYQPVRIVLVGDEATLPAALAEAARAAVGPNAVLGVGGGNVSNLVNALGKVFSFRKSEWSWFADRYGMDLSDLNAPLRTTSWYDQPHPVRAERSSLRLEPAASEAMEQGLPAESSIPAAEVSMGPAETEAHEASEEDVTEQPVK